MALYIMLVGRYPFANATLEHGSPASPVPKDRAGKAHGASQGARACARYACTVCYACMVCIMCSCIVSIMCALARRYAVCVVICCAGYGA